MARLTPAERAKLPDSAFAYVDPKGQRRLPIHDQSHVRNALARFDQVKYETEGHREKARNRLLRAAKKHGIMPVGFIERQLRSERSAHPTPDPIRVFDGQVTLLLTDIEGSTRLLRRLGDQYESVLESVRRIVGDAARAGGGVDVEVRADETFCMFDDAAPALTAALSMQGAMATTAWPEQLEVKIRIGIHTGTVRHTSNGYIGLAIHKADRVRSLANGGQIICSAETRSAAKTSEPESVEFSSLGGHSLAGLASNHTLYQITEGGFRG